MGPREQWGTFSQVLTALPQICYSFITFKKTWIEARQTRVTSPVKAISGERKGFAAEAMSAA